MLWQFFLNLLRYCSVSSNVCVCVWGGGVPRKSLHVEVWIFSETTSHGCILIKCISYIADMGEGQQLVALYRLPP